MPQMPPSLLSGHCLLLLNHPPVKDHALKREEKHPKPLKIPDLEGLYAKESTIFSCSSAFITCTVNHKKK